MQVTRVRWREQADQGAWRCRFVLVTAIGAVVLGAGCDSNSAVATTPTQVKCQVALAATSSSIGADGGTGAITVTTAPECPWDVSTGVNWLSGLSPTSGQGSGTVEFRVAPNLLPSARDGDIVINDSHLRVSQQAAPCRFELRPGSLTLDAAGGSREVVVSAAGACAWTVAADASWISFTTPVTGNGDGTVGVSIAPNTGAEGRVGTIVLGDQRFTVTQAGAAAGSCTYTIGLTPEVSIPSPGGSGIVAVSTSPGCGWAASSSVTWVTVISGAIGAGSGSVAFSVATNAGSTRTGTITVAGQRFTVTQAAADHLLHLHARSARCLDRRAGRDRDGRCIHKSRLRVDGEQQRGVGLGQCGRQQVPATAAWRTAWRPIRALPAPGPSAWRARRSR